MKLLIAEIPLLVLPNLAEAIGLNEAIFLQQLHYWLSKSSHKFDGRSWIYNTAAGWEKQFPFWSEATIRRTIKNLKNNRLIETTSKFNQKKYDKTNWFSINYGSVEKLESRFDQKATSQNDQTVSKATSQIDQMHAVNLTRPIPEITRDKKLQPKKPAADEVKKSVNKPLSDHAWFTHWWCYVCESISGAKYPYKQKDAGQVKQLLKLHDLPELVCRACVYQSLPAEKRFPRGARTIGGLLQQIAEVHAFDDELMDRFIQFGYLPDDSQPAGMDLKNFQPWKERHVEAVAI